MKKVLVIDPRHSMDNDIKLQLIVENVEERYHIDSFSPQNAADLNTYMGGKFYDFNPADNNAEGEHTSFVPEGYHVEASTVTEEGVEHTIYTVKKD